MARNDISNFKTIKAYVQLSTDGTTYTDEPLASRLTLRMSRREVTYDALKQAPLLIEPGIKEYTGRLETGWIDFSFADWLDAGTHVYIYFYDVNDDTFFGYIYNATITSIEDTMEAGAFKKETIEFRFTDFSFG